MAAGRNDLRAFFQPRCGWLISGCPGGTIWKIRLKNWWKESFFQRTANTIKPREKCGCSHSHISKVSHGKFTLRTWNIYDCQITFFILLFCQSYPRLYVFDIGVCMYRLLRQMSWIVMRDKLSQRYHRTRIGKMRSLSGITLPRYRFKNKNSLIVIFCIASQACSQEQNRPQYRGTLTNQVMVLEIHDVGLNLKVPKSVGFLRSYW